MTEDEASEACLEILTTRCTAEARAVVIAQILATFLVIDVKPKSIKEVALNIANVSIDLALRLAKERRRARQPPTAH